MASAGRARKYKRWVIHVDDLPTYLADDYPGLREGQILAVLAPRLRRDVIDGAMTACFQALILSDEGDKFTASARDNYWTPDWGNGGMHGVLQRGGFPGLAATRATIYLKRGAIDRCVLHFRPGVDRDLQSGGVAK